MNKVKDFTHKVFYDNKALLIFSFILAVVIWLVVMLGFAPIDTRKISGIVVVIESQSDSPSALNLAPFGFDNNTVDITIEGKRYAIYDESVNKDSFKAVAKTTYVSSPGKYALQIEVSKLNENGEYEIIEISQEYVEVYFDEVKDIDLEIVPMVNSNKGVAKDGYYAGEPYLSINKTKINNISISGPTLEVNTIQSVVGEITIESQLDKTTTWDANINAYNDKNGLVHNLTFIDDGQIQITQPIYRIIDDPVKLIVDFKNKPQSFSNEDIAYEIKLESDEITADNVSVAVENISDVNKRNELSIKTIDFAELKPGKNTITIKPETLSSIHFFEDIGEITIIITVNKDNFDERTFEFDDANIRYADNPDNYLIDEITKSIGPVTVYGPISSLDDIEFSDIYAEVDLSKIKSGEQTLTATIEIIGAEDCWAYGTYTVTLVASGT